MKVLKIIIGLCVFLSVSAVAALYLVPNYIDWNAYKPQVEEFIKKTSGYDVTLKGDLAIKTMPNVILMSGGLAVKALQGEGNLVETGPVALQLDLKNLLFMRAVVDRISVESPTITLMRSAEGVANWEPKTKRRSGGRGPNDLGAVKSLGDVVISNLNLTFDDAQANVHHKLENLQLSADGHDMTQFVYNLSGDLNAVPFKLKGNMSISLLQEVPMSLELAIEDFTLAARGVILEPFGDISINFSHFDLKASQPFTTLQRLGLLHDQPNMVFKDVDLKTKIQIEPEKVVLSETVLSVNNTTITGTAGYELLNKINNIKATLKVADFDMNAFFPQDEAAVPAKRMGPPWDDTLIDTSFFRRNNVRLTLEVGTLSNFLTPTIKNVEFKLNAENGVVLVDSMYFRVGSGEFRGSGRLDAGTPSRYQWRGKYDNIPIESFISGSKAEYLEIPVSGEMEFLFSGNSTQEMVESLNGKASLNAAAGIIKGVSLADPAIALTNFLSGKKVLDKQEKFVNAVANFDIANGVVRNDDLSFDALKMSFKGKGKIDLVKWTIAYRLDPITRGNSLANIVLGVRVQGDLTSPLAVPIMDNKTTGAAIGTALGGPVGAGIGALIGGAMDAKNQNEEAPKPKSEQSGTVDLPFDFSDVNNLEDNVRRFLEEGKPAGKK